MAAEEVQDENNCRNNKKQMNQRAPEIVYKAQHP